MAVPLDSKAIEVRRYPSKGLVYIEVFRRQNSATVQVTRADVLGTSLSQPPSPCVVSVYINGARIRDDDDEDDDDFTVDISCLGTFEGLREVAVCSSGGALTVQLFDKATLADDFSYSKIEFLHVHDDYNGTVLQGLGELIRRSKKALRGVHASAAFDQLLKLARLPEGITGVKDIADAIVDQAPRVEYVRLFCLDSTSGYSTDDEAKNGLNLNDPSCLVVVPKRAIANCVTPLFDLLLLLASCSRGGGPDVLKSTVTRECSETKKKEEVPWLIDIIKLCGFEWCQPGPIAHDPEEKKFPTVNFSDLDTCIRKAFQLVQKKVGASRSPVGQATRASAKRRLSLSAFE